MFSRLTYEDKQAFFELLDEYFESRPHLFSQGAAHADNPSVSQPAGAAAAAMHRTMASNPQATAGLVSAGLMSIPKTSQYGAASNPAIANAAGRFAASSIASSYGAGTPAQAKSPPAPPRRNVGSNDEPTSTDRPSQSGGLGGLSSFMSSKRFGDVDTSSVKSAIASSFRGGKPAPAPASASLPPAFSGPKRSFAPPPARRVPANAPSEGDAGDNLESRHKPPNEDLAPLRRMPSDRALRETASPEPHPAPEDLNVRQGDKLIIVERTSDDWWTGEMNGKRGLLPASYVRIL